jgi:hypothetical protein
MASIKINDLSANSILGSFNNSESFMNDLSENELDIQGGLLLQAIVFIALCCCCASAN